MLENTSVGVYILSGIFILAGIMHFILPKQFVKIMPPSIPKPLLMVYLSGVAEIVLGIAFLFSEYRGLAGMGLILLLIVVFPANIYMAKKMKEKKHPYTWLAYLRIPLQFVLMYWVYLYL